MLSKQYTSDRCTRCSLSGRRVIDARDGGVCVDVGVLRLDVDVYCRRLFGGGSSNNSAIGDNVSGSGEMVLEGSGHTLCKIARRVPLFATVELEDRYNVSKDVTLQRDRVCTVWKELTTDGEKWIPTNLFSYGN